MAKILVIDDEKAIRYALKEILEHEKHSVDEAEDGATGLDKARKGKFDLVLCDIKMPKMDGLEVLEKLQAHDPDLPVVMISGHGTIDTAVDEMCIRDRCMALAAVVAQRHGAYRSWSAFRCRKHPRA